MGFCAWRKVGSGHLEPPEVSSESHRTVMMATEFSPFRTSEDLDSGRPEVQVVAVGQFLRSSIWYSICSAGKLYRSFSTKIHSIV